MVNYVTTSDFTKIKHDTNGNPRYVLHFTWLNLPAERLTYAEALARARPLGGRKFRGRAAVGGIVFSSYALCGEVVKPINDMLNKLQAGKGNV